MSPEVETRGAGSLAEETPPEQLPAKAAGEPNAEVQPKVLDERKPATLPLLLEVGCEEIPARFLSDAEHQLGDRLMSALAEVRLVPLNRRPEDGDPKPEASRRKRNASKYFETFSTPRRLITLVPELREVQPDVVEEVTGPPASVAFDSDGKPTRAAESFAARQGVQIHDLRRVETPKGTYIAASKTTKGQRAERVLSELLPRVIGEISFPKSMIWEPSRLRFARPIRWMVALLGEGEAAQVIPFEVSGVQSGNVTYRHRLARNPQVAVTWFKDYASKLRRGHVEIDSKKRLKKVRKDIQALLDGFTGNISDKTGGAVSVVHDEWLEDWIVRSTEWPHAIMGCFDSRFLELPREILITVMRDHQKYFAVEQSALVGETATSGENTVSISKEPKLAPHFITVLNVPGDPEGIIRRGHERVLTARLEDAKFFWHADQKIPLRNRTALLERVTYQAKLGSYTDKVGRMRAIAEDVCATLEQQGRFTSEQRAHALRAVDLCKCDLTTQMVQEFTELQGKVGGLYAKAQGEPEEVWQAIYDHYKPVNIEDECPRSLVGAVVSLADKLDAVVAGLSVGLEPTGSSDPFGLRRAGNGIVKIGIEAIPGTDLHELVAATASLHPVNRADLQDRVEKLLRERVEYHLREAVRLRYDTIRAVVNSTLGWAKPEDAKLRGVALEKFVGTPDFAALSQAAKRTRNILAKSASIDYPSGKDQIKEDLFTEPQERDLFRSFNSMWSSLLEHEERKEYRSAFRGLAGMRPVVDAFFDHVLVMAQDPDVQRNRLLLLNSVNALIFSRLADLSQIESIAGVEIN